MSRNLDESELEESKRMDESDASMMTDQNRMSTKEKVAKLKEDLKKRKAMLRGEIDTDANEIGEEEDIVIDTSK